MHKAEGPSNYFFNSFTHYQAEQIKKGIICVQIFYVIHQTEPSRVHVLGGTSSFTLPVLVVVLLLCSHFHNDLPPESQQNVSMAAVWGAITCLGHSNVVFIL